VVRSERAHRVPSKARYPRTESRLQKARRAGEVMSFGDIR
jgi:hypothetical protein